MYKQGKIHKVPADDKEALASGLMGLFEKRRFRNFLAFCADFDEEDESTWGSNKDRIDPRRMTMQDIYRKYNLDADTADFTGKIC